MTSLLQSPEGVLLSEISHGTNSKAYRMHLNGKETSINSIACMFAWTQALLALATLENNSKLQEFAEILEDVIIKTV